MNKILFVRERDRAISVLVGKPVPKACGSAAGWSYSPGANYPAPPWRPFYRYDPSTGLSGACVISCRWEFITVWYGIAR